MIVFVGPIDVGKTSLIQRICYGTSLGSETTVACCIYRPEDFPEDTAIWDTPGDDRFSWMADGFTARADTIVYCEPAGTAHTRDYAKLNPLARILRVSTKADLEPASSEQAKGQAEGDPIRTSARTGEGVAELRRQLLQSRRADPPGLSLSKPSKNKPSKKCALV